MPKLTDEQLKLLHAHLDGETSDDEADEARELLEDAGAREYFDTFLKMRSLVKSHSAIPTPKSLKDSVLANIKSEVNAGIDAGIDVEAPIHQLPTARWWAPLISVAAAVVLVLAVTFIPRGESGPPADVAKQSLPPVSDEADEGIEENSRALNELAPEDASTGTDATFGKPENNLREMLDPKGEKDYGIAEDLVDKFKKGKRAAGDSQPQLGGAPESEKAESKQGENSDDSNGIGSSFGGRAGQAPAKASGTGRKSNSNSDALDGTAEGKELDEENNGGTVEKLSDDAPADSRVEESEKSAPEDLGKGESEDSKGGGWGSRSGSKGASRKDANEGKEDAKAAPKPESTEAPNEAVESESDEAVTPPAVEPVRPAAAPEPRQQVGTQVVEIASPAGKKLAAQADLLWVSGLYGQAEIDGNDNSDVEAITVEVSTEQLPKLIAALKELAKEQNYGQITLPEKQQAVDGVVKVVIHIK